MFNKMGYGSVLPEELTRHQYAPAVAGERAMGKAKRCGQVPVFAPETVARVVLMLDNAWERPVRFIALVSVHQWG